MPGRYYVIRSLAERFGEDPEFSNADIGVALLSGAFDENWKSIADIESDDTGAGSLVASFAFSGCLPQGWARAGILNPPITVFKSDVAVESYDWIVLYLKSVKDGPIIGFTGDGRTLSLESGDEMSLANKDWGFRFEPLAA